MYPSTILDQCYDMGISRMVKGSWLTLYLAFVDCEVQTSQSIVLAVSLGEADSFHCLQEEDGLERATRTLEWPLIWLP